MLKEQSIALDTEAITTPESEPVVKTEPTAKVIEEARGAGNEPL